MREIAERLGDGHHAMRDRYEIDFNGVPGAQQPIVNVTVKRDGVQLQMSARRPF